MRDTTRRGLLLLAAAAAILQTSFLPAVADPWPASVKIGGLLPLTGNAGFLGEEIRQGLDLYVSKHAAPAGGAGIDMVYVDSQADPRLGFQGFQRLSTRDETQVVVLTYTNVAVAIAAQANRAGTAMFNLTQGPVTGLGKNFTSSIPSYADQAEVVIKNATDGGMKKLAIIYENTEAYVRLNDQIQKSFCPKYGCQITGSEQIPAGGTDVSAQVTAALAGNPDAVIAIGVATQLIPIMRELKTRRYAGTVLSVSEMDNLLSSGNAALAEGATYAFPSPLQDSPAYKAFLADYHAKYAKGAPLWAALGYQAGEIISSVITKMKADGKPWSAETFEAELRAGKFSTVFGDIHFGSDGRIREPLTLVTVKNGAREVVRIIKPEELK